MQSTFNRVGCVKPAWQMQENVNDTMMLSLNLPFMKTPKKLVQEHVCIAFVNKLFCLKISFLITDGFQLNINRNCDCT